MVVCNAPLMQLPATCPIAPVAPYLAGLCQQLSALQINVPNQRYTPVIATSAPLQPVITQSATLRCSPPVQLPLTPPDSPQRTSPPTPLCNNVNLATLVPITNGITPIVPIQAQYPPKIVTVSTTSSSTPPTAIYTCNSGLVQCSQRVLCGPGVCSMTPATLEVIPSTSLVSSTPAVFPINPPSSSLFASSISAWKQSYGMEQVWQHEFKSLFSQYSPHNWMLFPVIDKPEGMWHTNVDSAKVRFCCEDCGHGWTSMKGRVAWWFVQNIATGEGVVCLKLYGQQCDRCKSGNYETAMWYPEEVLKVLVNIYNRVGQVYYGFQQAPYHRARRAGKPRTPHNSDLCQACKDGVCSERR